MVRKDPLERLRRLCVALPEVTEHALVAARCPALAEVGRKLEVETVTVVAVDSLSVRRLFST